MNKGALTQKKQDLSSVLAAEPGKIDYITGDDGKLYYIDEDGNKTKVGEGADELVELSDVELTKPTTGQTLVRNAKGKWVNQNPSGGVDELAELSDVELSSPTTGQTLVRNAKGKWVNQNPSGGVDELAELSDVELSKPTTGQTLVRNAKGKWVNQNPSGGVDELAELSDVELSSPTTGQTLVRNAKGKWVNQNPTGKAYLGSINFNLTQNMRCVYDAGTDTYKLWLNTLNPNTGDIWNPQISWPNSYVCKVNLTYSAYDAEETYAHGDLVAPSNDQYTNHGAALTIYKSKANGNVGNNLTDTDHWEVVNFISISNIALDDSQNKQIAVGIYQDDENTEITIAPKVRLLSGTSYTPNGDDMDITAYFETITAGDLGSISQEFAEIVAIPFESTWPTMLKYRTINHIRYSNTSFD